MTSESNDVRYLDWVEYPHARVRVEIDTDRGTPTRFVVQLERRVAVAEAGSYSRGRSEYAWDVDKSAK